MRTYDIAIAESGGKVIPHIMPFYTAGPQNSLERGTRPYTVTEILRGVFREDFHKAVQAYMDQCPEGAAVAAGREDARDFRLISLGEPRVESSLHQPACTTAVDLLFHAVVEAMVPMDAQGAAGSDEVMVRRRFTAEYRVRYLLKLWDKQCSAPMIAPSSVFPPDRITEQKEAVTNQYLLPVMYAEDYALAGRRMLERYYPEALDKPTAVDGMELAGRMKLKVMRVRFAPGSDILGQIYFDDAVVGIRGEDGEPIRKEIPAMTVLVNTDLCRSAEVENSTIIHECCHVFLDLPFFKLQMLSGKAYKSYTSRKRKKKGYAGDNGPIDWMELQAEKMPAYILMEENNTRKEIERLLAQRGGVRSPENIYRAMCQLSSIFRVSRSMAKYRMIELGYPEAEGVYTYIDNIRIPDYGCSGPWERGVTYAISLSDAGSLLRESKDFADALQGGQYIYLEGHFCLDSEPYVQQQKYRQAKRLSEYARRHIEECCIAFTVRGRYTDTEYEDGQAARKKEAKNKYQSRHGFGAEPDTKERVRENAVFAQDSQIWAKLRAGMPEGVREAIQLILNEKGISQQEMALRMGVSRTAWQNWCSRKMSFRHIVAVCIALDVRADIGLELVRLAGLSILNNKEHNILLAMLFETKDLTVARANEIMRQEKLPPLTEGKDEETAY